LRLPIRSVKLLSTSLRLPSDFFYLPCFFDALVPRPEIVAVENFPSISVNMFGVASENPDLRIRSWRGCAETSRNQDGPKIISHSQKPPKAESQGYRNLQASGSGLSAMTAMRKGAEVKIELADAAIAVIASCSNLANEGALATIGASERAFQTAGQA
jgi:hypothetical protein